MIKPLSIQNLHIFTATTSPEDVGGEVENNPVCVLNLGLQGL